MVTCGLCSRRRKLEQSGSLAVSAGAWEIYSDRYSRRLRSFNTLPFLPLSCRPNSHIPPRTFALNSNNFINSMTFRHLNYTLDFNYLYCNLNSHAFNLKSLASIIVNYVNCVYCRTLVYVSARVSSYLCATLLNNNLLTNLLMCLQQAIRLTLRDFFPRSAL